MNIESFAQLAHAGKDARVRLFNARLADVVHGRYFAGDSIVIRDGKIAAMPGLPGEPAPEADFELDLQGRTVIPGLFNAHCHLQMKYPSPLLAPGDFVRVRKHSARQTTANLADCLARGVTHLRDALVGDLRPNRALNARSEPGPRIHQCVLVAALGGTFSSPKTFFDRLQQLLSRVPDSDFDQPESAVVAFPVEASLQQVRDAVDRAVDERGARYIKFYDQHELLPAYKPGAVLMNDAQLEAACDQARKRGVRTTMHHTTVESFRRGVRAGVSSLAHLPCDALLTEADAQAFVQAGCLIEPTLTVAYCMAWPLPGIPWNEPWLEQLAEFRRQTQAEVARASWLPELQKPAQEMYVKAARNQLKLLGFVDMSGIFRYWTALGVYGIPNLRRIYGAGGRISCGTDAGAVPVAEGMIEPELAMLRLFLNVPEANLSFTPADSLRVATLHAAQSLALEDQFGSLQTGKVADLVVLDGDPFANPDWVGSRAVAVFKEGRLVAGQEMALCSHRSPPENPHANQKIYA